LDIGAADGSVARVLAGRGCRVSAIERDESAARQATLVCEHVTIGDIEHLDLEQALAGQRFDVVLLLDILEHLREPLDVLKRAAAVLVPSGQIIASIPNVAHGAVRLALLRGSFEYTETGLLDRTHLRFFDRPAIEGLFHAAGLDICDCLRVTRGLTETEIPIDPQAFPPAVVNEVAQDPESTTYQFVIVAVPSDESGAARGGDSLAARLQQRLLATERRFREVEAHARTVAQELDTRSKALEEVEAYARTVAQELDTRSKALEEVEAYARTVAQELDTRSKALEEVEAYARTVAQELDTRSKALDEARTRVAALKADVEELTSELAQARGILAAPSVRLVMAISARLGRFPRLRRSVRRLVRFVSDRALP
jgi:archaellum component FlaC